jgi:membrane protease YdiL (CAAX protease family)
LVFLAAYLVGDLTRAALFGGGVSTAGEQAGKALVECGWTIAILAWLGLRHRGWWDVLRWPARAGREAIDGGVFGLLAYGVIGVGVVLPLTWFVGALTGEPRALPQQLPEALVGLALPITAIQVLVVAPIAEELFFRGVFFRAIRDRHGVVVGAMASAMLFALFHTAGNVSVDDVVVLATTFALGIALAVQYERRRNLLAPLAAHVAFNLLGVALFLR